MNASKDEGVYMPCLQEIFNISKNVKQRSSTQRVKLVMDVTWEKLYEISCLMTIL